MVSHLLQCLERAGRCSLHVVHCGSDEKRPLLLGNNLRYSGAFPRVTTPGLTRLHAVKNDKLIAARMYGVILSTVGNPPSQGTSGTMYASKMAKQAATRPMYMH